MRGLKFSICRNQSSSPGKRRAISSPVNAGTRVLGWRPDRVRVCAADDAAGQYPGTVLARGFLGDTVEYLLQTPLGPVKGICAANGAAWREGTAVSFVLPPDSALCLAE